MERKIMSDPEIITETIDEIEQEIYYKIKELYGGSVNKITYLITIGDYSKDEFFVSAKVADGGSQVLEIIGYQITEENAKQIRSHSDAVKMVNKEQSDLVNIKFPWHRVKNIKNVTFKPANRK